MSAYDGVPQLSIGADLRFDIDGNHGTVVGDGRSVVVFSESPLRLLSALRQVELPSQLAGLKVRRAIGAGADYLSAAGMSVEVRGERGALLVLGAGHDSKAGRWLTGSGSVELGSSVSLASVVAERTGQLVATRKIGAAAAVAAFFAVVSVVIWRRR